jgi:hypothetical protein
MTWLRACLAAVIILGSLGCAGPGSELHRRGDEIVICGRLFHTGAPVVLWTDPGGYDGYRVERRFTPLDQSSWEETAKQGTGPATPNRYGLRRAGLGETTLEDVRGGGWTLDQLRGVVDQFVLHYDVCGTSRTCFRVLHDVRGLSVHFMLDLDGTIYQTLDVKERAWHATTSNDRSVGIEIANIGAYPPGETGPLDRWYARDEKGRTVITIPSTAGPLRTPGFVARPARNEPVVGMIQGRELVMYDLTPEQYDSLGKLTKALTRVLPGIRRDVPRDALGQVIREQLDDETLRNYRGILGHYHIQQNKIDPGPALDWDKVVGK